MKNNMNDSSFLNQKDNLFQHCVDFRVLPDNHDFGFPSIGLGKGFWFENINNGINLSTNGTDGFVGLICNDDGLSISVPNDTLALWISFTTANSKAKIEAYIGNELVDTVWSQHSGSSLRQGISIQIPGVDRILISKGRNEVMLHRICVALPSGFERKGPQ